MIKKQLILLKHKRFIGQVEFQRDEFLISKQRDEMLIEDDEPTTYEESLNSSESNKWFTTMTLEMDSIHVYKPSMDFG